MREQVKESKRSKATTLFILFFFVIFFCILIFILLKDPTPIDFTDMSKEEVISAVKRLDKEITDANVSLYNKKDEKILFITFRPNILINLLTESAIGMQRITEKIMVQKGAEHFKGIYFDVMVNGIDSKSKESEQQGAKFFWSKDSLHGINWEVLTKDEFLNLTDTFDDTEVFKSTVTEYCSEEDNMNYPFCVKFRPKVNY